MSLKNTDKHKHIVFNRKRQSMQQMCRKAINYLQT